MAQTQQVKVCRDYDVLCDTLYGSFVEASQSKGLQDKSVNLMLVKREDPSSGDYVLAITKLIQEDFLLLKEVYETLGNFLRDSQMITPGKAEILADQVKKQITKSALQKLSLSKFKPDILDFFINFFIGTLNYLTKKISKTDENGTETRYILHHQLENNFAQFFESILEIDEKLKQANPGIRLKIEFKEGEPYTAPKNSIQVDSDTEGYKLCITHGGSFEAINGPTALNQLLESSQQ